MNYDRPVSPEESRRISLTFGVLYLITFATSIPALWLFQPVLDDPAGYVAGAGHDNRIFLAAFLELLLIIANIGTAVVIFPIVRRQNEELALGYVTARVIECTFILVGILCVLGIVTLRQQTAGVAEGTVAYTLAGIKDGALWGLAFGIFNFVPIVGPTRKFGGDNADAFYHFAPLRPDLLAEQHGDHQQRHHQLDDQIVGHQVTAVEVAPHPLTEIGPGLHLGSEQIPRGDVPQPQQLGQPLPLGSLAGAWRADQ